MYRHAYWLAVMVFAVACTSDPPTGSNGDGDGEPQPRPAAATTIAKVAGDGQTGSIGATLPINLTAQVNDQDGNPITGVSVSLEVGSGGGSLSAESGMTDASGQLSSSWTLGGTVGSQQVTAYVTSASNISTTFSATAAGRPECDRPSISGFDAGTASMLLDLADRAYFVDHSSTQGEVVSTATGCWLLVEFIEHSNASDWVDTQLFIARNVGTGDLVVAFRGSQENTDTWTDLWATGADWRLDDGTVKSNSVHSGFKAGYDGPREKIVHTVFENLNANADPASRVYFTGHSLGGALATLAALDLSTDIVNAGYHRDNVVMYSFAAPRSISQDLYIPYDIRVPNSFAVAVQEDVVPHVPTPGSGSNPYSHIPGMVLLNQTGSNVVAEFGPGSRYHGCTGVAPLTDLVFGSLPYHGRPLLRDRLLKLEEGPAPQAWLSVQDGLMRLNWSGVTGPCDWIGLYRGSPTDPNAWVPGFFSWQWASKGTSYTTDYAKGDNFYAGYVNAFDVFKSRTVYVPTTPTAWLDFDANGWIRLNWSVRDPGKYDFVALYGSDPSTAGTNGYVLGQWQWATAGSSWVSGRPLPLQSSSGWYVAYIQEDDAGSRRILAKWGPN